MWIDGGIHAREWISPATAMYIAHELILGYENDATVAKLMDHIDFYILPVMNPDGYEYSREKVGRRRSFRNNGSFTFRIECGERIAVQPNVIDRRSVLFAVLELI